tara:strand:- start:2092 stop:2373 length:282 start_codon:yes stop_codon:yes gene_type:complete
MVRVSPKLPKTINKTNEENMAKSKIYRLAVDVTFRVKVQVSAHNKKEAKEKALEIAKDNYINEFVSAKADKNEWIQCVGIADDERFDYNQIFQ